VVQVYDIETEGAIANLPREWKVRHWDTFDMKLEGARFVRLHEIVSKPTFDDALAERMLIELVALAASYGYGTADSYLQLAQGDEGDRLEVSFARERLFESYEDDDYFHAVRESEQSLYAAATTDEAKVFLRGACAGDWNGQRGTIHERMVCAFLQGRDQRVGRGMDRAPSAPFTP